MLNVTTSLFDLYKIGIGPSSSHTMGPMRAALRFANGLAEAGLLHRVNRVQVDLYGSLALTGKGHATDRAVLLGLSGHEPATVDPAAIDSTVGQILERREIHLAAEKTVGFEEARDLNFARSIMYPPGAQMQHPNGMRLTAFDSTGNQIVQRTFFSIGGGFITEDGQGSASSAAAYNESNVPFPFHSAAQMLELANQHHLTISELMLRNECALASARGSQQQPEQEVRAGIEHIWGAMCTCIDRGIAAEGTLPGGLNVRRRAHRLAQRLQEKEAGGKPADPLAPLDWVTGYAMAVDEENAAGGRVVTAPTNGAAGVVPAVARYYERFLAGDRDGVLRYFLTSAAIGALYKENASISGAEVGCQGEVGVACSMAAGGLTAALGGTNGQVEHAAEIAMEHNLGMTCDPIGGLVQIPCIERNAMGAVKAVQASRIALNETEAHKVSLDQVIHTMYQTGLDMQSRYKETSLAGLALNIIEC